MLNPQNTKVKISTRDGYTRVVPSKIHLNAEEQKAHLGALRKGDFVSLWEDVFLPA